MWRNPACRAYNKLRTSKTGVSTCLAFLRGFLQVETDETWFHDVLSLSSWKVYTRDDLLGNIDFPWFSGPRKRCLPPSRFKNHLRPLWLLLGQGLDPQAKDQNGNTVLHSAQWQLEQWCKISYNAFLAHNTGTKFVWEECKTLVWFNMVTI